MSDRLISRRVALAGLLASLPRCAPRRLPARPTLDDAFFWAVVHAAGARASTSRERLLLIDEALTKASALQLDAFDEALWAWFGALDRKELWAAAETLMGRCSDDGFMDFRGWLLLQGRAAVLDVVHDPDSLAGWTFAEEPRLEGVLSLTAAHRRQGHALQVEPRGVIDTSTWPVDRVSGYDWTEQDCERLFPRLSARARTRRGP